MITGKYCLYLTAPQESIWPGIQNRILTPSINRYINNI